MPQSRPILRWTIRLLTLGLALPLSYALAMLVLGVLPTHADWRMTAQGITIWLSSNGVHTDLLLPRRNDTADWTQLFPPTDTVAGTLDSRQTLISIGWGDRTFFLEVPEWGDLRPSTALRALFSKDRAALHVEYTAPPSAARDVIPITLSPQAYAQLTAFILTSAHLDSDGRFIPIAHHAYGSSDAFYEAEGYYSPFTTCNQWVRNALDAAGVRTPRWSPLDFPLFWQLRQTEVSPPPAAQSQFKA